LREKSDKAKKKARLEPFPNLPELREEFSARSERGKTWKGSTI